MNIASAQGVVIACRTRGFYMKTLVLYAGNVQSAIFFLPDVRLALYAGVLPGSGVEDFLNEC